MTDKIVSPTRSSRAIDLCCPIGGPARDPWFQTVAFRELASAPENQNRYRPAPVSGEHFRMIRHVALHSTIRTRPGKEPFKPHKSIQKRKKHTAQVEREEIWRTSRSRQLLPTPPIAITTEYAFPIRSGTLTVEQVRDFALTHTPLYPEIATARYPDRKPGLVCCVYLRRAIGSKVDPCHRMGCRRSRRTRVARG